MIKILSIILIIIAIGSYFKIQTEPPRIKTTPLPGFTKTPQIPSQTPEIVPQATIIPKPRVTTSPTPKPTVAPYLQYQWDCNKRGGRARVTQTGWVCDPI